MKFNSMVASDSNMIPVWFIIFALSLVSVPSSTDGKGLIRSRRQDSNVCADGTYVHGNRSCCQCRAGYRRTESCDVSPDNRECHRCEEGTYSSHPTVQTTCEPCTQCDDNANLEVDKHCSTDRNSKCRCKKDHYCDKEEPCTFCFPCKACGVYGIKVACTATNNTVCNEVNMLIIIPCVIIPIFILIVLIVLWRWIKRRAQQNINQQENGNATLVEMRPLTVPRVDLTPHLPEIAEHIGFNDMKAIAMRYRIPQGTIDNCQLDHPNHAQQQTIQLLKIWVESQGMDASVKLIQNLENSGKKLTAKKVVDILTR
ncbi:tumor necrosis factor receptor superfamily member 6 [Thunnus albacares]|uniref:tumor necrosis factor receptor superfamily member 6 n=1 Tax=Thunnus albacares TaxID=8236 RepID=UPI001CF6B86B|nr:tumor necrosis factor receptor superfamily member 6 [Thunnus albacares]